MLSNFLKILKLLFSSLRGTNPVYLFPNYTYNVKCKLLNTYFIYLYVSEYNAIFV